MDVELSNTLSLSILIFNGHSHVRASLMGPSITFPIKNGKLIHGTWQQLVFVELDTAPRHRNIIVQIVGE